ncbi:hypothetical protein ASPCAL14845 [Aspergillus calidoustus]|uniref:Uncharacterized protein n=1 Tax=Aspergillus calidoustus TaxID=454130 RepID=A0A0U5HBZ6_ASPCI|nr:hypothetical protein ASPCAL14845 [Aspergillus calidoustus]
MVRLLRKCTKMTVIEFVILRHNPDNKCSEILLERNNPDNKNPAMSPRKPLDLPKYTPTDSWEVDVPRTLDRIAGGYKYYESKKCEHRERLGIVLLFIDGSDAQASEGYEWFKLINLGSIRDDIQLFTSIWETVTGSYPSLRSPEFPQALSKNLLVLLGDTSC